MAKPERERLVHVGPEDFEIQAFCAGGPGGQKQNSTKSGCRLIHRDSGARGEAREHRNFIQNKGAAFERLVASPTFQKWLKIENSRALGLLANVERDTDEAMHPSNLRVEGKVDGKWVPVDQAVPTDE